MLSGLRVLTLIYFLLCAELAWPDNSKFCRSLLSTEKFAQFFAERKIDSFDRATVQNWSSALEMKLKDPKLSAYEVAKAVEVMNARQTVEMIAINALYSLQLPESLNELAKGLARSQAIAIRSRAKELLESSTISYFDLLDLSIKFATTREGAIFRFAETQLRMRGKLNPTRTAIRDESYRLQDLYIEQVLADFPFFFQVPTFNPLSTSTFNHTSGLPIGYIGLTLGRLKVDGENMSPSRFFFHDIIHNSRKKEQILRTLFGNSKVDWKTFNESEIREFFVACLSKNALYGRFERFTSEMNARSKKISDLLYFDFDHEASAFDLEIYELWRYFEGFKLTTPSSGSKKLHHFAERLNSAEDIGVEVQHLWPISEEEILSIVNGLQASVTKSMSPGKLKEAFQWVTSLLIREKVPFEVSGGLASHVYGGTRPVADIDLNLSESHFDALLPMIKPYVVSGPLRYRDASWDLRIVTLNYQGQVIDLAGIDATSIYNRKLKKWEKLKTVFAESEPRIVFGVPVLVTPRSNLIDYKKKLGRKSDAFDVFELERKQ